MSILSHFDFDLAKAGAELDTFESWLKGAGFVSETTVVSEIRSRQHMVGLLGPTGNIPTPDLVKWNLGLLGIYQADLVLGNDDSRQFLFVEFEGAEEFSLFSSTGTSQNRNWSRQLEHGFGQVVDWASLCANQSNNSVLSQNFGGDFHPPSFLLVCGRDAGISGTLERQRLNFRRKSVHIAGIYSQVLTYDEMVVAMKNNLKLWVTSV